MNSAIKEDNSDPDYEVIKKKCVSEVNESLQREDAREQTVQKIQEIINGQFSFEINLKEKEVTTVNERLQECRANLDRLRACILAGYYGYGMRPSPDRQVMARKANMKTSVHNIIDWKQSLPFNMTEQPVGKDEAITMKNAKEFIDAHHSSTSPRHGNIPNLLKSAKPHSNESRFYVKRRIIVGNTSKFILPEQRESNDRSSHKWMVYVRGPKDDGNLQNFISKVWFLLHPSYQPNDLVEVSKPPFQVTRRGWGEFPVRVQLHFVNNKNKRVDIIHHLKLDKSYTGLQTLGSETHVEVELDRKSFNDSYQSDCLLNMESANTHINTQTTTPFSSASINLDSRPVSLDMDNVSFQEDLKGLKLDKDGLKTSVLNDHSYSTFHTRESQNHEANMKYITCSTPGGVRNVDVIFSDSDVQLMLKRNIALCPVVRAEKSLNRRGYCASSEQEYLTWNLGKRLAAEWQRALDIKRRIEEERKAKQKLFASTSSDNIQNLSISTKDVMNYCRQHGYTPMLKSWCDETQLLCKFCGEEVTKDNNEMLLHDECLSEFEDNQGGSDTYMTAEEFLESLRKSEIVSEKYDEHGDDEDEIDVVGLSQTAVKDINHGEICFLPTTLEHEWVQDVAKQVQVMLTNNDMNGVKAPVTSAMLFKASCMFAEDIIRKANRFTWKSSLRIPRVKCILPFHVKQALDAIPCCDFLTNKYLQIEFDTSQD